MDCRSKRVVDYVSTSRNFTSSVEKEQLISLNWHRSYRQLCHQYIKLENRMNDLCKERISLGSKDSTADDGDKRSCLPFPETTNQGYGWLSRKPDFRLEIYGRDVAKYHNPMDDVVQITGDLPCLGAGKGYL